MTVLPKRIIHNRGINKVHIDSNFANFPAHLNWINAATTGKIERTEGKVFTKTWKNFIKECTSRPECVRRKSIVHEEE